MSMTLMYNGVQFAPVTAKRSVVVPFPAEVVWSVVGKFGRQASWMGSVEGQQIFTQLLGGETADYIGACRVFGIADKILFEQLVRLDNNDMIMGWQLMTHPMNSNPFPAAFVNFKAELRVWPISIPSDGKQCFLQWRMDLLTEQHAVAHMTQAMTDIMIVGLTNLGKYMDKSTSNSEGSSAGSHTNGGIVGSTSAPQAYGIQFMPQPQSASALMPDLSQALSGSSSFLQQPSFVPAPGQPLGSTAPSAPKGPFQHYPVHPPMQGPFAQQQFANYQANPGLTPLQFPQHPPQHFQPHANQLSQQQQAAAYQLQQHTQSPVVMGGGSTSPQHSSQHNPHRSVQRVLSYGSQTGSPLPGAHSGLITPIDPNGSDGSQLFAVPSQKSLQESVQHQMAGVGHAAHTTMSNQQLGQGQGVGSHVLASVAKSTQPSSSAS